MSYMTYTASGFKMQHNRSPNPTPGSWLPFAIRSRAALVGSIVLQHIVCSQVALSVSGRPGFAGALTEDTHDGD